MIHRQEPPEHGKCSADSAAPSRRRPGTPELLAPAGGMASALAAFQYGADAVYLGLRKFSARAEAENFDLPALDSLTAYAHSMWPRRRVYVALNTLVLNSELSELVQTIAELSDIGVDALITQDLGLCRLVRRHFPELALHASTQMAIHNADGVAMLRELGFKRVTLARELTLPEIRRICGLGGIEVEVFAHGALCYSYSGLCLLSSHILGRSGNRGRCAYLCRDRFDAPAAEQDGFFFSMKDLAVPNIAPELGRAGVTALKIEGRMKSPLYVAAVVNMYRQILDGTCTAARMAESASDIRSIFSRPWTELYLRPGGGNVTDIQTVGHRGTPAGVFLGTRPAAQGCSWLRFKTNVAIERHDGLQVEIPGADRPFGFPALRMRLARGNRSGTGSEIKVEPGSIVEVELPAGHPPIPESAAVCLASSQAVRRKYPLRPVNTGRFRTRRDVDVTIMVEAGSVVAIGQVGSMERRSVLPGKFEPARDRLELNSRIRDAFGRMGESRFKARTVTIHNPAGLFVPISALNRLRRELISELECANADAIQAKVNRIESDIRAPTFSLQKTGRHISWSVLVENVGLLADFSADDLACVDEVVVNVSWPDETALDVLARRVGRDRIRLALPLIIREREAKDIVALVRRLKSRGWRKWQVSGLGAWRMLSRPGTASADIVTDWSLYVTNRLAAMQAFEMGAERVTLSPEDGADNVKSLIAEFGRRVTLVIYQDTPLLISETRLFHSADLACQGRAVELKSAHGDRLMALTQGQRTVVIHARPFCIAPRAFDLAGMGMDLAFRADFMFRKYAPCEVADTWRRLRAGLPVPGARIANWERGLA